MQSTAMKRAGRGTGQDQKAPQSTLNHGTHDIEDGPPSPPSMPSRPASYHQLTLNTPNGTRRSIKNHVGKDSTWMKPYRLESPSEAIRLPSERTADLFPWTGSHPEDVLSDQAAKQGYYDKVSISQNETGTGRTSLWPIMKHKSGLQVLSSLFVSVLDQRQSRGRITSASTFKPPPRVTLTDAKREAWLRDLANPLVPLRRLSRTIPHGIRGRMLLDQCLSKGIPTARAVWLIKCVGANEIRAFKRKGVNGSFVMGGESKYFRDWTGFVEQFMDSLIAECGTPGWRGKVLYTIRLCAHLYTECLLDRGHYFDWILKSLETCTLDALPMWLLTLQIFWEELLRSRKNARRLAEILLSKFRQGISPVTETILLPVLGRVSQLVIKLLRNGSRCFIMPTKWPDYRTTLLSCIENAGSDASGLDSIFHDIDERNQRLRSYGSWRDKVSDICAPRQLVRFLDSLQPTCEIEEITFSCLEIVKDTRLLTNIILKWASNAYRDDAYCLFVAVRVLRQLHNDGVDIDTTILDFLAECRTLKELRKQDVYQIVSELVSSRDFSVGRYLQWVIARGGIIDYRDSSAPCDIQLLAELPLYNLPSHLINLRQMLLAGIECDAAEEQQIFSEAKIFITTKMSCSQGGDSITEGVQVFARSDLENFSRGMKAALSHWLRQWLRFQMSDADAITDDNLNEAMNMASTSAITYRQFSFIRDVLEIFNEYPILADVLRIISMSEDPIILTSVADTINYHIKVFCAIGVTDALCRGLLDRYRSLRSFGPQHGILLTSLIELMSNFKKEADTISFLLQERASLNQRSQVAASSPISEHATDLVQSGNNESLDEIDRILSSANNIDRLSSAHLFDALIHEAEIPWTKSVDRLERCSASLAALRFIDPPNFDGMILEWLDGFVQSDTRPKLIETLPTLIGAGCLSVDKVVTTTRLYLEQFACEHGESSLPAPARLALEMLEFLINKPEIPSGFYGLNCYRFLVEQQQFVDQHSEDIIYFLDVAVHHGLNDDGQDTRKRLNALPFDSSFLATIKRLVVSHLEVLRPCALPGSASKQAPLASYLDHILNTLFLSCHSIDLSGLDLEGQLQGINQVVDALNLPFYQLKLLYVLHAVDSSTDSDYAAGYLVKPFLDSIGSDNQRDPAFFAELMSGLSNSLVNEVREEALREMLSTIPSLDDPETFSSSSPAELERSEMFLGIIKATMINAVEGGTQPFLNLLIEKFSLTLQSLQVLDPMPNNSSIEANSSNNSLLFLKDMRHWITTLLRLVLIHHGPFQSGKDAAVDTTRLTISMACLLIDEVLQQDPELLEFLFDVLTTHADELSEDARMHCIRFFQSHSNDWRLKYLFDYQPGPNAWLHASAKGKLFPHPLRPWEMLAEPTPNAGDNDASLNLAAFQTRKL